MELVYDQDGILIFHGDCREVLRELDSNTIDACITDPPYGLEFMGKGWDKGVPGVEFWQEIFRVLKPGAHTLAFGGTRTFHRLACAIEDSGFELRDCLMWLYGQGFPKSMDISKAIDNHFGVEREVIGKAVGMGKQNPEWNGTAQGRSENSFKKEYDLTKATSDLAKQFNGYGTALKPAWEPVILGMKPTDGTFAENASKWGVAGLNIDGCRIGTGDKLQGGRSGGSGKAANEGWNRPWMNDGALSKQNADRAKDREQKAESLGRFPANLILDESAGKMLDEQSGVRPSTEINSKGKSYASDAETDDSLFGHRKQGNLYGDSGGASRFFYCPKASKSDRGHGNNHPTVKPIELMKYLCKLASTPTGGLILDPFMGSGTTLVAAKALGRPAIGIELNKEYCDIAIKRLENVLP